MIEGRQKQKTGNNEATEAKSVIRNFRKNKKIITKSYKYIAKRGGVHASAVDEWILDNFFQILEIINRLDSTVNLNFFLHLRSKQQDSTDLRLYKVMASCAQLNDFHITAGRLNHFVKNLQESNPLNISELWAIPIISNLILLEKYAKIISQAAKRIEKIEDFQDTKLIRHITISLQNLNNINWNDFVERHSVLEKILRTDPAGVYGKMDFTTRDLYRHSIEEVAFQTGANESNVAEWLIQTATFKKTHIGYFLFGKERSLLESSFAYKKTAGQNLKLLFFNNVTSGYIFVELAIALVLLVLFITGLLRNSSGLGPMVTILLSLIVLCPILEVGIVLSNFLVTKIVSPRLLYKMEPSFSIATANRTLIAIPTLLLANIEAVDNLIQSIQSNYLANNDSNIFFALLVAFPESKNKHGRLSLEEENILEILKKRIANLNEIYPGSQKRFLLFYRERVWNESEKIWVEWERKRGKLLEFNRLLRGASDTSFSWHNSNIEFLRTIKYVLTIDQDIFLLKESAKNLISIISHPLNKAVIDPQTQTVVSGYGIVQPRLSISNENKKEQSFIRALFSVTGGWDSYSSIQSDVYQDLFGESFYLGKAIYDVDVFNIVLQQRLPLNTLLSHDHIEGFYCRTAYASDVQIYEDFPTTYLAYRTRLERWIRGDWQRMFWIFDFVRDENNQKVKNPLVYHQRWKLIQDGIQTLVLPSIFLLLILGWAIVPQLKYFFLYWALGLILYQTFLSIFSGFKNFTKFKTVSFGLVKKTETIVNSLSLSAFYFIFLADHFIFISSAIAKALFRTLILKRKQLQWTTAYQSSINNPMGHSFVQYLRVLKNSLILLSFLILVLSVGRPETLFLTIPIFLVWFSSIAVAGLISAPLRKGRPQWNPEQTKNLRLIARKTWRFYEELVSPETNFLPPDHYQSSAEIPISPMTSITNIGMYLLSVFSAYDLGYLSCEGLLNRLNETFGSLKNMSRLQGHFFNWYKVRDLSILAPQYISTVDSGNFAGALVSLKQGLIFLPEQTFLNDRIWKGLLDQLLLVSEEFENDNSTSPEIKEKILQIQERLGYNYPLTVARLFKLYQLLQEDFLILSELKSKGLGQKHYWLESTIGLLGDLNKDLLEIMPILSLDLIPTSINKVFDNDRIEIINSLTRAENLLALNQAYAAAIARVENLKISEIEPLDQENVQQFISAILRGALAVRSRIDTIEKLAKTAQTYFDEMNFSFLYDKQRNLFRIGYNFSKKRFDRNYYDFLSSEARLASFIAIAKNDVPLKHWSTLGRQLTVHKGEAVLLSWGGSLFEYLFPLTVMPNIEGGLFAETYLAVVRSHIDYAWESDVPWGISESSFLQTDKDGTYKYKLHGIPSLGLKQYPYKDLVVSPYSSFLALEILPAQAYKNILRMQEIGAQSDLGFYEAIDYNKYKSLVSREIFVKTFLSHHQGTILVSISNSVLSENAKTRFSRDKIMNANLFVLEEKTPTIINPFPIPKQPGLDYNHGRLQELTFLEKTLTETAMSQGDHQAPLMHALLSAETAVYVSNRGSGFSRFSLQNITHWNNDPTFDGSGSFIYLKDLDDNYLWSATYQPTKTEPERYSFFSNDGLVRFNRLDQGIESELLVRLFAEQNIEIRVLTLTNRANWIRRIQISSYNEIDLGQVNDSLAHPAFTKMRLENQIADAAAAITYHRKPIQDQTPVWFTHLLTGTDLEVDRVLFQTDRAEFLGRLGQVTDPVFGLNKREDIQNNSFTLDSIASISTEVSLDIGEEKKLYFVNSVSLSESQVKEFIHSFSDSTAVRAFAERPVTVKENPILEKNNLSLMTAQQFHSCLLFGRSTVNTSRAKSWQSQIGKLGIFADRPFVTIELNAKSPERFLRQLLGYAFYLSSKRFYLSIIIIVWDTDEYYKPVFVKIQEIIDEFEADPLHESVKKPQIFLLQNANLELTQREILLSLSSLNLNANNDSLARQIELEFKRL